MLAIQTVREDESLQLVGFKSLVEELTKRARQEFGQSADIITANATKTAVQTPHLGELFNPTGMQVGWRLQEEWLQVRCQSLELSFCCEECIDIVWSKTFQFTAHQVFAGPPADDVTVVKCSLNPRVAGDHLQTVRSELEIAYDRRPQHAGDVGGRGDAASRCEIGIDLFGDGAAADNIPALEHEDTLPGPGEIGGGSQAIVAGSDDDGVVLHTGVQAG